MLLRRRRLFVSVVPLADYILRHILFVLISHSKVERGILLEIKWLIKLCLGVRFFVIVAVRGLFESLLVIDWTDFSTLGLIVRWLSAWREGNVTIVRAARLEFREKVMFARYECDLPPRAVFRDRCDTSRQKSSSCLCCH